MLKNKLESGCTIKLLVLDSQADVEWEHRAVAEEVKDVQHFKSEAVRWHESHSGFVDSLPPLLRERIEVRQYSTAPDYFIVDNDRTMLLGFYLRARRGEEVPHVEMEVKRGGAYRPFREHFEALWKGSAKGEIFTVSDRRRKQVPVKMERRQEQRRRQARPVAQDRRRRKIA